MDSVIVEASRRSLSVLNSIREEAPTSLPFWSKTVCGERLASYASKAWLPNELDPVESARRGFWFVNGELRCRECGMTGAHARYCVWYDAPLPLSIFDDAPGDKDHRTERLRPLLADRAATFAAEGWDAKGDCINCSFCLRTIDAEADPVVGHRAYCPRRTNMIAVISSVSRR